MIKTVIGTLGEDLLVLHYSEKLLFFRLNNALDCFKDGKPFFFRGCGWKRADAPNHSIEDAKWAVVVKKLLNDMFGTDFLEYEYDKEHGLEIKECSIPTYEYDHELWEETFMIEYESARFESVSKRSSKNPRQLFETDSNVDSDTFSEFSFINNMPVPLHTSSPMVKARVANQTHQESIACHIESSNDDCSTELNEKKEESKKHIDFIDCPVRKAHSCSDLSICHANAKANRVQLANLELPRIVEVKETSIKASTELSTLPTLDPLSIKVRPSECALRYCDKVLSQYRRNGEAAKTVQFGQMGSFRVDDLWLLRKYCNIDKIRREVIAEAIWLNQDDGLSTEETKRISRVLWDNEPSKVILRMSNGINTRAIDVTSFSNLCEERYIDNMIVNIAIYKYMLESNLSTDVKSIVLPSEIWAWRTCPPEYLKEQVQTAIRNCQTHTSNFHQILIPVYMPSHWGLVYVDLKHEQLYFDDGLKFSAPSQTISTIKCLLDILRKLLDKCTLLKQDWWRESNDLGRLGMPRQDSDEAKNSQQGSGSCGIGVVMAAKDLLFRGKDAVRNFTWSFAHSRYNRKQLMQQILLWSAQQ